MARPAARAAAAAAVAAADAVAGAGAVAGPFLLAVRVACCAACCMARCRSAKTRVVRIVRGERMRARAVSSATRTASEALAGSSSGRRKSYLMREATSGQQRSSTVISGHPMAIRWQSRSRTPLARGASRARPRRGRRALARPMVQPRRPSTR